MNSVAYRELSQGGFIEFRNRFLISEAREKFRKNFKNRQKSIESFMKALRARKIFRKNS